MTFLNNGDELPQKEKRKNGSIQDAFFEPTSDPNIIRTTDGKRYIRTESGEYKEVAE
jgi:hypothetical protein